MAKFFESRTLSEAWWHGASHLLALPGHRCEHLILAVSEPQTEICGVRELVDQLMPSAGISSVIERVADTIFPQDFYDASEENAADRLFERRADAREFESWSVPNGNYFDRMCEYPQRGVPFNQVKHVLNRLRASRANGHQNGNQCEIGVSEAGEEVRLQCPGLDRDIMGFPCLSHISVTLAGGRVHLAATYRSQFFVEKAYGNLLGLSRLGSFLAKESGFAPGELVCVATGATLGSSPGGMFVVRQVVNNVDETIKRSKAI